MIFFTFLQLVYVSGSSVVTELNMPEWQEFNLFQSKFQKQYKNIEEMTEKFEVFRTNVKEMIIHNLNITQTFTMGVNQFSDLTADQFKQQHINNHIKPLSSFGCELFDNSGISLVDDSFDWREKGMVNSVRDQGQCGSCWTFSTTSNAESVWAISSGELLDLSEQYLVDCATGIRYLNQGCSGGNPDSAFKFMIANGQCLETDYPYVSGTTTTAGECVDCNSVIHFSSCMDVASGDQVALRSAVNRQPVAIAIEADTRYFQSYSGGILTSVECGTNLDHAVEIVGYGTDNGTLYWTIRNSWSDSWGEDGYIRILRSENTSDTGICGLAIEPSFIVV